jgi:hypothetical protein
MYISTISLTSSLDGVGGQRHAPLVLPLERAGSPNMGDWVGPRARLDGSEKFRLHWDSIPRPSSL